MKMSVTKNYLYNLCFQIIQIITPVVLTPYLTRTLGPEGIGVYGYVQSIVVIFMLFGTMGVNIYAQREIAYVQNDIKKRSQIFFEIIILRFLSLSVIYLIYFFIVINYFNESIVFKIASIYIISSVFEISFFFQGMSNFRTIVLRNIIIKLISIALILLFVKVKEDINTYVFISSIMLLVGNISIWYCLPSEIIFKEIFNINPFRHLKEILLLFLPQIALQIYTVLDKTMLGLISNINEVGYYESTQKIVVVSMTLITSLGTVMLTKIASNFSYNDIVGINKYISNSLFFVSFLSFPMTLGIFSISDQLVPWFLGEDFVDSVILLKVMSPLIIISCLSNVFGIQYLIPLKKHKLYTYSVFTGAIVNVILNLILIPKFKSLGATLSTVAAEMIVLLVSLYFVRTNFSIINIFKSSYKFLLASFFMYIFINYIFISNSLFIKVILGIVSYLIICLVLFIKDIKKSLVKF